MKTRWWKRDKAKSEKPIVMPKIPPPANDDYRERAIVSQLAVLQERRNKIEIQDEAERRFAALHPLLKPNTETKEN